MLIDEYYPVFLFAAICFGIGVLLLLIPFVVNKLRPYKEKLSSYECGIEPVGNARFKFDVRFFSVAIMFIVFDIEIMLLLPWAMMMQSLGLKAFFVVMMFLTLLVAGLIYEWHSGAMDI